MDKLVPPDVLKVLQGLVLPLELKINSLLEAVRSLEAKLDEKNATQSVMNEGKLKTKLDDTANAGSKQQYPSSYAATVSTTRTPATQRADPKPLAGVTTRKQRAQTATATQAQVQFPAPALSQIQFPQSNESQLPPSLGEVPKHIVNTDDTLQIASGDNTQQWRVVRGKHRKLPMRGAGEIDSDLTAVEKVRQIHLWSLRNDITAVQVQSYMAKKCSTGAPYAVEKLQLKHTNYASFVLAVPESLFDFFMTAKNWPPNTEFNEWFRRRAPKGIDGTGRPVSQSNS